MRVEATGVAVVLPAGLLLREEDGFVHGLHLVDLGGVGWGLLRKSQAFHPHHSHLFRAAGVLGVHLLGQSAGFGPKRKVDRWHRTNHWGTRFRLCEGLLGDLGRLGLFRCRFVCYQ